MLGCGKSPVNDICENADPVLLETHYTGTTEGMTDDSVWFVFTPTVSDIYTLSICDSEGGYFMVVYDGCEGDYLGETDFDCQIPMWMNSGEEYLIEIMGWEQEDEYDLFLTQGVDPPGNDICGAATPLSPAEPYAEGATLGATGNDESALCGTGDTHDVWYTYTPDVTGYYTVTLFQTYGSFSGTVTVYDGGTCSPLPTELACEELSEEYVEIYDIELTASQTYLIRVASDDAGQGPFGVDISGGGPM